MICRNTSRSYLALRNGQDKPEIWVALHGIIYDVTGHDYGGRVNIMNIGLARTLTDELKDAPHDAKVFDKFKIIGKLKH